MKSYKKKIISYTLKTIAYTFCAIGCAYQVISIINLYFSFPTTVFSFIEIMDRLELPAITLCTNNLIMLNKMKCIDPKFNQSWTKLMELSQQNLFYSNQTRLLKQKLIDHTIRKLMDQLPVYDFSQLGTEWNDLLTNRYFKCATDPYNVDKKCIDHSNVIQSAQELGNCFTVFRRSENRTLKEIAIKSGISQSPVIRGVEDSLNLEIADQPFHPNEVFRMMINFSLDQRTTLNEKVMGHLAIHDENELPPIRNRNFIVYPGYYYEFYISKESGKYLPSPYVTDCVNYDREKSHMDKSESQIRVMSRETCIMDCIAKQTINLCKCWPPELPFIVLDQNNSNNHLKWCSWRDGTNIVGDNSSKERNWFHFCFANHEKRCKNLCKIECKSDSYEILRQSVIWPSQERIDHSKKYDMTLRKCCTLISIRFWSSEQSIQDYQPKYEFVEFISYFGGLLSIWLGFSFVKTYDIGELVSRKIISYIWQYGKQSLSKGKSQPSRTTKIRPRVSRYLKNSPSLRKSLQI
ncbi:amiloride-sensitive sodium channel [Dermatophagoides farinae]|uniref:Amiloride-sensitive sodium channel n=1 Tax=Dermatophagoides farinae TaxID=6954 RepID=A0A922I051_DERFA|nr:amiloride-sensitive sodium channel [Dermatophagoides farinae]